MKISYHYTRQYRAGNKTPAAERPIIQEQESLLVEQRFRRFDTRDDPYADTNEQEPLSLQKLPPAQSKTGRTEDALSIFEASTEIYDLVNPSSVWNDKNKYSELLKKLLEENTTKTQEADKWFEGMGMFEQEMDQY